MSHLKKKPLLLGTVLQSDTGRSYTIDETLSERTKPLLSVYRARDDRKQYIVKHMIPGEFEYQLDLQKQLSFSSNIRAVVDTVQELELFIYPFLHIKPNNIMVDYEEHADDQINIRNAQITDLEDTVILPPGQSISDGMCGNAIWRSPESWCRARQSFPSDVFSFGIVMIYVMVGEMVFLVPRDQLEVEDAWRHILRRHISYFADEDSLNGFLSHIETDNPFFERLLALVPTFVEGNLRQPIEKWRYLEPDLKDLPADLLPEFQNDIIAKAEEDTLLVKSNEGKAEAKSFQTLDSIDEAWCQILHGSCWRRQNGKTLGTEENLPTYGGAKYFLVITDDATRFRWVFLLKGKPEAKEIIKNWVRMIKNTTQRQIRTIHSDGGGVFTSQEIHNFYKNEGIQFQETIPYTPQENGTSERTIGILSERLRSMIYGCKPEKPTTPFEAWTGVQPDVSWIKKWECDAYKLNLKLNHKLEPRSEKLKLVGYHGLRQWRHQGAARCIGRRSPGDSPNPYKYRRQLNDMM
ncbi:serine/threonine protein kinase [[Emmonsia] crescens]|uniref:Serine/threonine protein kinase n=1 Tax=[Emmonsia] crescens TaxID=73230 RepID=A0A2B7ZCF7_9EURO|nr:serine/threonine protein kinase [Emmonsia crescens]